jgi:hypothetical protein
MTCAAPVPLAPPYPGGTCGRLLRAVVRRKRKCCLEPRAIIRTSGHDGETLAIEQRRANHANLARRGHRVMRRLLNK